MVDAGTYGGVVEVRGDRSADGAADGGDRVGDGQVEVGVRGENLARGCGVGVEGGGAVGVGEDAEDLHAVLSERTT